MTASSFAAGNMESPITDVVLKWGQADKSWHPDVTAIFLAFKHNPYSKFMYQTDIAVMRSLCGDHSRAITNQEEPNAALIKAIYAEWKGFGATISGRAQIRYTLAQSRKEENYDELLDVFKAAQGGN